MNPTKDLGKFLFEELTLSNLLTAYEKTAEQIEDWTEEDGPRILRRFFANRARIFKKIQDIDKSVAVLLLTREPKNV
jgi:hypothetical protein